MTLRSTVDLRWFLLVGAVALSQSAAELAAQGVADPCNRPALFERPSVRGPLTEYLRAVELERGAEVQTREIDRLSDARTIPICLDGLPASVPIRSDSGRGGPLRALPSSIQVYSNGSYADDRNNGPVWEGKGTSATIQAGAIFQSGVWTLAVAPAVSYQQNQPFPIVEAVDGYSPFAYRRLGFTTGQIDLPQRMGADPFWRVAPGDSYLRVALDPVKIGVSTENLWWGPGIRNSILMSNTAEGFPHLFLGTARPIDVSAGTLGMEAIWGELRESPYFDDRPDNDRRLLRGLILVYSPSWDSGLRLGAGRTLVSAWGSGSLPGQVLGIIDPTTLFAGGRSERSATDQIISFFARWTFPEAGFEAYGEWARTVRPDGLADLLQKPETGVGYTLGLQKAFRAGPGILRLLGELTDVGGNLTSTFSASPSFYTGSEAPQGYTNRGQMLGAGIGPAGDSQHLRFDWLAPFGTIGLFGERYRRDSDSWYRWVLVHAKPPGVRVGPDAELALGFDALLRIRSAAVTAGFSRQRRYFRYFDSPVGYNTRVYLGLVLEP